MSHVLDAYSTNEIALGCGVLAILLFAGFCWLISYVPSRVFVKQGDEFVDLDVVERVARAEAAHGRWLDLDQPGEPAHLLEYQARRIEDERVTVGTVVATSSYRKQE